MGVIFDLDQTLVDSTLAERHRKNGRWPDAYNTIPNFKIYDGVNETINFLNTNKIPIAIVTTSPRTYCQKVIDHWKITYSHIVAYHDTAKKKPHPDPMIKAMALMGVEPNLVISFGDRGLDIQSGKAAKIKTVGCLWGSSEDLKTFSPDFLIDTPAEMIPIITEFFNIKSRK